MVGDPIHPFLWEVTLPAVRAAWAAGREYVDSGRFVPREESPNYTENNSGWPSTVRPYRVQVPHTAPIAWTRMFSVSASPTSCVLVEVVPEFGHALAVVIDAALKDEGFADGMSPLYNGADHQERLRHLTYDYLSFIGSIIGRAEATRSDTDEDLRDIYLQLEKGRFAPELMGDLVVPVTLTDFGSVDPLVLSEGVRIERMSKEFQCGRSLDLGVHNAVSPYLIAAATHAIVIQGITLVNRPYSDRIFSEFREENPIAKHMVKIDRVIQCVHIVTGVTTGYNQILVRPDGWADRWKYDLPALWKFDTVQEYPDGSRPLRPAWNVERREIDPTYLPEIVEAYLALETAPDDVNLAARRLVRAKMRTSDEDRTLDATIGIEALLLKDNAELKFRMALRAAAALCEEYRPDVIFALTGKVYDHRSEIAHGLAQKKASFNYDGATYSSSEIAPFLLSTLLKSRLLSSQPWNKDNLDDRILSALASYKFE